MTLTIAARPWAGLRSAPAKPKPAHAPKPLSRLGSPLKEWHLQAAAIKVLRRAQDKGWPIRVAGDMNAARRTKREAGRAKATGLLAGEPDVRVYLPNGKLLSVEYKRLDGKRSNDQINAHKQLTELGFEVVTLAPANEDEAEQQILELVSARLGLPIPSLAVDNSN